MLSLVTICKPDTVVSNTLKIYKCSTFTSVFSFFEADGTTPLNLTSVTEVTFHLLQKGSTTDYLTVTLVPTALGSVITITNPLTGQVTLTLTDEETCLIPFGGGCSEDEGTWWISLTYPGGVTIRKAAGKIDIRNPFES